MSSGHNVEFSPSYDLSAVQYSDFSKVNYFQPSDSEPETANEQSEFLPMSTLHKRLKLLTLTQ